MCAGRATHQPTSNGGENIACHNKSLMRGVSKRLPSVPKKSPLAPRDNPIQSYCHLEDIDLVLGFISFFLFLYFRSTLLLVMGCGRFDMIVNLNRA